MHQRTPAQTGFTIIELLIVMTIGGILAAIAVPSFRDLMNDMRTASAIGVLVNDLNQARGEAVKRNVRVVVCVREDKPVTPDVVKCVPPAEAGTNWQAGWLVCIAAAGAGAAGTDTCADATLESPNPLVVRPALVSPLNLTSTMRAVRFVPDSSAVAAILTLRGTCRGVPTDRAVTVQNTGSISKQECPK